MQETSDPALQVIATKLNMLHGDVAEVKSALRDMASAITRLAVLDERQATAAEALARAFKHLEQLEDRVDALERQDVSNKQTSVWVQSAMGAAAALIVTAVLRKMGFM